MAITICICEDEYQCLTKHPELTNKKINNHQIGEYFIFSIIYLSIWAIWISMNIYVYIISKYRLFLCIAFFLLPLNESYTKNKHIGRY